MKTRLPDTKQNLYKVGINPNNVGKDLDMKTYHREWNYHLNNFSVHSCHCSKHNIDIRLGERKLTNVTIGGIEESCFLNTRNGKQRIYKCKQENSAA